MLFRCVQNKIFGKKRIIGNCPNCLETVIIDEQVFRRNKVRIECYKCNSQFIVLSIDNKQNSMKVNMVEKKST